MVLLTSSQVSIAFTSGIVILCTFSLFLSGYVLQQRTLTTLRAAIREPPRPSPELYLPDRFSGLTTELEDGTVVPYIPDGGAEEGGDGAPTLLDVEDKTQQAVLEPTTDNTDNNSGEDNSKSNPSFQPWAAREDIEKETQPVQEEAPGEENSVEGPPAEMSADDAVKPLSAAERGRRIKAEIRRLAMGTEPVYYQRRLY